MKDARPGSTRDRLVIEGLRLFAAQGYRATTVGDIEAAAGLQPRRGALYRHFASKEKLLEEVVRRHLDSVREGRDSILDLPLGDVRTEALMLGRFILDELMRERQIMDVFEQEGKRMPELRDLFRERVADTAYLAMTQVLRRWLDTDKEIDADLEGYGVLVLGALTNVHRFAWTFGRQAVGLDNDQMVVCWADMCVELIAALRRRPRPDPS